MKKLLIALIIFLTPILSYGAASWVLSTTSQTDIQTAINNDADGGVLKIYDASNNVLATLNLPAKASNSLDTPSAGILTFGAITSVTATGAGTADHFIVYKSGGSTALGTGNIAASSASMNMTPTLVIGIGDTIAISAMTWTVPAGT